MAVICPSDILATRVRQASPEYTLPIAMRIWVTVISQWLPDEVDLEATHRERDEP